MSKDQTNEMKQIDEDSDSVFDSEEWYFVGEGEGEEEEEKKDVDDDDEVVVEEEDDDDDGDEEEDDDGDDEEDDDGDEDLWAEMLSTSLDVNDCGRFQLRNSDCYMIDSFTSFPPHMKKKEDMEIKDIVKENVLPFLPAKSLIRFRSVSVDWNRRIRSPFLAHQQSYCFQEISGFFCQYGEMNPTFVTLNHHAYGVPTPSLSFLPELVKIISSSNGLLLCQGHNENNTYYVCNPANNEWKKLPKPEYYHGSEPAIVLALEPSVLNMGAHYQLICAAPLLDHPVIFFEMYSSRTRSWRLSTIICVELGEDFIFRDNGFYMKGTAYWETSTRKVLAFNPTKEIHGIISLPSECPQGGVLTQMYEELCYIGISNGNGNECFIEIYGGVDLSLKHKIEVHLELALRRYRVLPCVDGNIVMIINGGVIHSYSLRDQKLEVINREAGYFAARYLPYVNSLVCVA